MSQIDVTYNTLISNILRWGYKYRTANRPDVECQQISSANVEITLETFPLLTTKEMYWKGIVTELIWFLQGGSNIKYLVDNDVNIWNKDAYNWYLRACEETGAEPLEMKDYIDLVKQGVQVTLSGKKGKRTLRAGDVGRNYGVQWRSWTALEEVYAEPRDFYEPVDLDQIGVLLKNLNKTNPINRRHIVSAWNPAEETALPPCHWSWEIIPRPLSYSDRIDLCSLEDAEHLDVLWKEMTAGNKDAKEKLDKSLSGIPKYTFALKWHQRSVDTFLG